MRLRKNPVLKWNIIILFCIKIGYLLHCSDSGISKSGVVAFLAEGKLFFAQFTIRCEHCVLPIYLPFWSHISQKPPRDDADCCMWYPVKHQKHDKNIISIWGPRLPHIEMMFFTSRDPEVFHVEHTSNTPAACGGNEQNSRTWCQSAAKPSHHLVTAASKYWKTSKSGFYCQPFLIHPVFLYKWWSSL